MCLLHEVHYSGAIMGKRDSRVAFVNPIAAARASGPAPSSGPSIKDFFNRPRPSWDEVKEMINKRKAGSGTLAAYEEHLNQKFKDDLRKNREKALNSQDSSAKKEKKKSKKRKKRRLPSSSSSAPLSSGSESDQEVKKKKEKKRKKRRKRRHAEENDASDVEEVPEKKRHKKSKKKRKHRDSDSD